MLTPGFSELNAAAAIAARKSFRAAANDLGIPASALSHAVASLESRLGVRLFNRTTRSVSLTPAGEQFLTRVKPVIEGERPHQDNETREQREVLKGNVLRCLGGVALCFGDVGCHRCLHGG